MTIKENATRILFLETRMRRLEYLLWYVAGSLSIQLGKDILPSILV